MEIRDFKYTIIPASTKSGAAVVMGCYQVIYHDADTGIVLGGWDTCRPVEDIERTIEENRASLIEKFQVEYQHT